jgi:hypothetical protein
MSSSLEKNFAANEKALGRNLAEARAVAGVTSIQDANTPSDFGRPVTPVPNCSEGQRSGANAIIANQGRK